MIASIISTKSAENTISIIRTYSSVQDAKDQIEELQGQSDARHIQIVVDYSNVEFYKEKYEELFDMFVRKGNTASSNLK